VPSRCEDHVENYFCGLYRLTWLHNKQQLDSHPSFRKDWGKGCNSIQPFSRANQLNNIYIYAQMVCISWLLFRNHFLWKPFRRLFSSNTHLFLNRGYKMTTFSKTYILNKSNDKVYYYENSSNDIKLHNHLAMVFKSNTFIED
jgi:Golgi nucleoside diphosphatase